jgi:hypothetical protein
MNMQASSAGDPGEEKEMALVESQLRRSLYRFDCPQAHALGEYELGLLAPEQRTSVAAHALECDECRAELQTLRAFLATPTVMAESMFERARRVVATLFTPAADLAYGGLRGSSTDQTARVYVVDDISVTLGPGQGPGTLIGLVLVGSLESQDLVGRQVRLVHPDRPALVTHLDDIGNFEFADIEPGVFELEIELPDRQIVVEELRLG